MLHIPYPYKVRNIDKSAWVVLLDMIESYVEQFVVRD